MESMICCPGRRHVGAKNCLSSDKSDKSDGTNVFDTNVDINIGYHVIISEHIKIRRYVHFAIKMITITSECTSHLPAYEHFSQKFSMCCPKSTISFSREQCVDFSNHTYLRPGLDHCSCDATATVFYSLPWLVSINLLLLVTVIHVHIGVAIVVCMLAKTAHRWPFELFIFIHDRGSSG